MGTRRRSGRRQSGHRDQDLRHRPRGRDPARRHHRPRDTRARGRVDPRSLELVAAALAGAGAQGCSLRSSGARPLPRRPRSDGPHPAQRRPSSTGSIVRAAVHGGMGRPVVWRARAQLPPEYQWVIDAGWNIADCVSRSSDLEGMEVGTVGAGRIGSAVLRRLKPFEVELHYPDRHRLPEEVERELGLTYRATPQGKTGPAGIPCASESVASARCSRFGCLCSLGAGLMAAGPVPQAYSSPGEKRKEFRSSGMSPSLPADVPGHVG